MARRNRSASALFGNRAHHGFVEIDVLDLDSGDLDAPDVGLLVQYLLDVGVQPVAFGQHLVEFVLAKHRTERGLGELTGRGHIITDLDDGALGIDDAEVENGIDLDRDVVARNHILGRHDLHHYPEVDLDQLLHDRNEDDEAGPLHPGEAPEREDNAAFVFPEDANGLGEKHDDDQRKHCVNRIFKHQS
ncbi:hypothetical protein ACVWZZ_000103 [Bradyrhizobium sp. LM6.10]